MNFIDLTGQKFHKLTVIERCEHNISGHILWLCKCDCGNFTKVTGNNLKRKNKKHAIKSCGCLNKYPEGEAAFKILYRDYKNAAKIRRLAFTLSEKDFRNLVTNNCFYCNSEPKQIVRRIGNNGDFIYNGIDRVDNTKGYILDNCVSCCGVCNNMKRTLKQDKFISQVLRISENIKKIQTSHN